MNCQEARILLSAYRELDDLQSIELDTHLEACPACRQELAQQSMVGERLRLLPIIEPAPDAHAKLMQALAAEHTRYLQRSTASTTPAMPAPDFLKPYIKEHVQKTASVTGKKKLVVGTPDIIAAMSTAETGPLPILSPKQRRRKAPMNQFAIMGLAAVFLLTMLTGGLVSLLLLASHNLSGSRANIVTSVAQQSQVTLANASTQTVYPNIVSAVASDGQIYYSAYGDGSQQWMIERTNNSQKSTAPTASTPLLSTASSEPLFVLGVSHDWLIWLQLDTSQAIFQHTAQSQQKHNAISAFSRKWTLYALPLTTSANTGSIVLTSGVFYTNTAPSWVHTPVQGLSFEQQNTLLLATVDAKGDSQLVRYLLDGPHHITSHIINTASNGHILTSPTANSNGTSIFWAEEWAASDNVLHGNIWEQQQSSSLVRGQHGWQPLVVTSKGLFRADETSFHPQVVNNTLFWLDTNPASATTASSITAQGTPNAVSTASKANATPTPAKTTTPQTFPIATRLDPVLYLTQVDETLPGTLLSVPLDNLAAQPKSMGDVLAAAPQGGTRFLLWQTSNGYQMYDTAAQFPVVVSSLPKNATFLDVNGNTTVWMVNANGNGNANTGTTNATTTVTFNWFSWPGNS